MKQKVEILVEEEIIKEIEKKAEETGIGLAEFLGNIIEKAVKVFPYNSNLNKLAGLLKDREVDEEEYKEHLTRKYL